ncbi:hypothetical protein [Mariniblastus fucicola]|uniref:Uncharacterized protein n=1 Tax=Mariniblastus fucicola TaxID=980251 RepID=A0A5B9PFF9_9BACT|nr:hypothetical protein [Mariniblastus fucicola]QEG21701.1 hypothetical protein MFFC18_15600 [Mariniblastus fucicola]
MLLRRSFFCIIPLSLFCAGLMLSMRWWIADADLRQTVNYFIVAAWWIPFSIFLGTGKSCCKSSGEKTVV